MRILAELVVVLGGVIGIARFAVKAFVKPREAKKPSNVEAVRKLLEESKEIDRMNEQITSPRERSLR